MSQLLIKSCNGDFDGDACNIYPIMDQKVLTLMKGFDTKYTLTNPNGLFKLEKYLTLLSTGNQILAQYLLDRRTNGEDKIKNRLTFVEV